MYKQTVVLNSVVNRSLKIFPVKNFEFARQYNSCILLSQEFMEVSKYYPIGFSKTNDMLIPVAILGVNKNLFIGKNGLWVENIYIPAFIRRYPFIALNEKDSTDVKSIVCVDADYTGYDDPNGERVFNDDGTNTQFLENILNFLQTYQRGLELTKLFGQHINDLNILTTKDIGISLKSGQKYTIRDVLIIDEKSLLNLPDLEIAELVRKKYMEWIYFHLNSLKNFDTIINAQAKEVEN